MKKYRYMILLIIFSLLSCSKTSILFDEAVGLDNQKKYLEAIIVWDKLIEYDPAHLSAYISRSADKFALGQYLEAIKDYCYVIEQDSTYITAWLNRGNAELQLKNYKVAIEYYNSAERIKQEVYGYAQVVFDDKAEFKDAALEEICLQRGMAY